MNKLCFQNIRLMPLIVGFLQRTVQECVMKLACLVSNFTAVQWRSTRMRSWCDHGSTCSAYNSICYWLACSDEMNINSCGEGILVHSIGVAVGVELHLILRVPNPWIFHCPDDLKEFQNTEGRTFEYLVYFRSVLRLLVAASVVPSSPILVTLMEALSSPETSVLTRATWYNIPEDAILHSHRRHLKSCITDKGCNLEICRYFVTSMNFEHIWKHPLCFIVITLSSKPGSILGNRSWRTSRESLLEGIKREVDVSLDPRLSEL
jgi:hypothetical protein